MLEYGKPISAFRRRGAAIVIGTSTSILNKHAAKLAELFVEVLSRNKEIRLGEIIRSVKCQALLKGLVMPLCIVAYGDADWILS
jgi:ABC-type proline/glycine betaine transport system ATPase subunit